MEEKDIEFKGDFDVETTVHKVGDVDPQEDLGVEEIEELPDVEPGEQLEVTIKKKREAAREKLAFVFVIGLFLIIVIAMIVGLAAGQEGVQNIIDLVLAISGVLAGPLGFIIGYYYKKQDEAGEEE